MAETWQELSSQLQPRDIPFPIVETPSGNYTVGATDGARGPESLFDWTVTGGSASLSLPNISLSFNSGRVVGVRLQSASSGNTGTITPFTGQTIEGQSNLVLTQNQEAVILANNGGTDWIILSHTGSASLFQFADNEDLDSYIGSTTFTLLNTPSPTNSLQVVAYDTTGSGTPLLNGIAYTLVGVTGTFVILLDTTDVKYLRAWYRYV